MVSFRYHTIDTRSCKVNTTQKETTKKKERKTGTKGRKRRKVLLAMPCLPSICNKLTYTSCSGCVCIITHSFVANANLICCVL